MTWENFWDWLDRGLLLITMCVSIYNICVSRKNNDDISVILTCEGEEDIQLVQTIKRKHFTRSELQGVLSNNYTPKEKGPRFYDIKYLGEKEFIEKLREVQDVNYYHIFPRFCRRTSCTENKELPRELIIKIDSITYDGFSGKNKAMLEKAKKAET